MSALVKKEIRLLLPAWITAMLLVVAPIPLGLLLDDFSGTGTARILTVFGVAIGCSMLGLAGFGREISSRTLSLLLAQPRPRKEFWRAKVGVLLVSLIPLVLFLGLVSRHFVTPSDQWMFALIWFVTTCVAVTGGLWTTLLFRQIIPAFWVSVIVPFGILVAVMNLGDEVVSDHARSTIVTTLLLAYSITGYFFARWQFLHAQDVVWTGGDISATSLARWLPRKRTATARGRSHPLWALLCKEFQFQQINFLLAALLLVAQIAALLLPRLVNTSERSMLDLIAQNFWVIWIVMPLLVGCGAVAEERKLGTLESQLCLPVARTRQFAVKVFVTLVCSLVLGAIVPVAIIGLPSHHLGQPGGWDFAGGWALACVGLSLVSLYASSLTNHMLQAFGAAIGIIVVGGLLALWFAGRFSIGQEYFILFGQILWRPPLVFLVGTGVMLLAAMGLTWRRLRWVWGSFLVLVALSSFWGKIKLLPAGIQSLQAEVYGVKIIVFVSQAFVLSPAILTLVLTAKNFRHVQTSLSLWRRNSAIWLGCLVLTGIITTLVYNRVWEFAMRFEPPAGPSRLSGPVQPVIAGSYLDSPTFVLLPDGRLCTYQEFERLPPRSESDWRLIENPRVEFIGGSNWVVIAATRGELAGVQADGSLWKVSWFERVDKAGRVVPFHADSPRQKGITVRKAAIRIERIGDESTWTAVAGSWSHFVALKRDGTIWGWGDNGNKQLGDGPKFITDAPIQIGRAVNWTAVYAGTFHSYAINRAGEIWRWGQFATHNGRKTEEGPVKLNIHVPAVRSIVARQNDSELILDTDGNLWGLGYIPPALGGGGFGVQHYSEPKRIGGTNWLAVSCNWAALAGLKTDGTLWCQRGGDFYNWPLPKLAQLGQRTDWIAVSSDWQADVVLAKDGTICRFGESSLKPGVEFLAPTRRVTWSVNLLDAVK